MVSGSQLIGFAVVVILIYMWMQPRNLSPVRVGVREWNMIRDFDNRMEAAEMVSRVNKTMIEFMRALKKKYHIDETDDVIAEEGSAHTSAVNAPNDIYNMVDHLLRSYNPDEFHETDPRYTKDTSYTLNKGASTYVCVRDKTDPTKLVRESDLLFVMLHEATHMANYKNWGHEKQFWAAFKWILYEAQSAGVYVPIDYKRYPTVYCGLKIDYQPLFDDSLPRIWEAPH